MLTMPAVTAPSAALFGDADYLAAGDLERLADALRAEHPGHFRHLAGVGLAVLWKKKGGTARGQARLGQCQKTSGLARFWGEADFAIWLAADHLFGAGPDRIASALFHELLHLGTDEETGEPTLVGHDVEAFFQEVAARGLWHGALVRAREVFVQAPLPTAPDGEG